MRLPWGGQLASEILSCGGIYCGGHVGGNVVVGGIAVVVVQPDSIDLRPKYPAAAPTPTSAAEPAAHATVCQRGNVS